MNLTLGATLVLMTLLPAAPSDARAADPILGPLLELPNRVTRWRESGFVEMVPPVRLPTDPSETDVIQVWLKLPPGQKLSAERIHDGVEQRYTLLYPPGTIADRVEFDSSDPQGGVGDVRGARIDEAGAAWFHVYETAYAGDPRKLVGYEWKRAGDREDRIAGEALAELFFGPLNGPGRKRFLRNNYCADCHRENQPMPASVIEPFFHQSDSRGFFQPITILKDEMTVRTHRARDLNVNDPFVSVWCGAERATLREEGRKRWYECPRGAAPLGRLDLASALAARDSHAMRLCEARSYLHQHMDEAARAAFAPAFEGCGIPAR